MKRAAKAKTTKPRKAGEKVRLGPLAARRDATRLKVFQATIECLEQQGYSATTTLAIVKRAKISRGAMLKQFPTRAHLFDALVNHLRAEGQRMADELFEGIPAGIDRAIAWADIGWELYGRSEFLAMLELGIGARGDPEISDLIAVQGVERERSMLALVWEDMKLAGAKDKRAVHLAFYELLAVLQGLAIERFLNNSSPLVEDVFRAHRKKYTMKLKQLAGLS